MEYPFSFLIITCDDKKYNEKKRWMLFNYQKNISIIISDASVEYHPKKGLAEKLKG